MELLFGTPPLTTPKEAAIAASFDAQNRKVDGWGDTAIDFLKSYRLTVKDFLTEDLRNASVGIVEVPSEPRAWGAVLIRACKMGRELNGGRIPLHGESEITFLPEEGLEG